MRKLVFVLALLIVAALGVYVGAGFMRAPAITVAQPERFVGMSTPVEVHVDTPRGELTSFELAFEQHGTVTPLGSLVDLADLTVQADGPDRLRITRQIGRDSIPGLQSGPGRLLVTAVRPVAFGVRHIAADAARDVEVRLERPRLSVLSTHHYINQGGAELVVYRVTPEDAASGVQVGELEYPGYPAAGVTVEGVRISDPAIRIAFFALLHDQPPGTPIRLFARDEAGNTGSADFASRVFPKAFRESRITLDDAFLDRVVPAILETTTEIAPQGPIIDQYVAINSELRQKNAERIASFAGETSPGMLWLGQVFHPYTNNAVESAFADRRTYLYQGREVDRQVHLGFDLASYAQTPIVAANRGRVLVAEMLGIYGNTVILDHGMGLQSLYAHLSSIDIGVGATVEKSQVIGRSGITGLAGGDHLHFTMLLNGRMINPVEWWDAHWIEDRILRKLRAVR
jgi:murein DD-endopeptidase MepM/ murein hydrolase activator NlpD